MTRNKHTWILPLAAAFFLACGAIGTGGYPSPQPDEPRDTTGSADEIVGDVVEVDTRRQEIEIRTDRGQNLFVLYEDGVTPVWYEGQRYEVSNLEAGDHVRARVATDRYDNYVADEIRVIESRQDRYGSGGPADRDDRYDGSAGEIERLSGTVRAVDTQRGEFTLEGRSGGTNVIRMPYETSDETRRVFSRLEPGDFVQIVAEAEGDDHYHLVTFERHDE
jgi:hypothetical protein